MFLEEFLIDNLSYKKKKKKKNRKPSVPAVIQ